MNHVSKIIIIILIIIIIIIIILLLLLLLLKINKRKIRRNGWGAWRERERENLIFFISFFTSFSDLWKSDRRFSSGLKTKFIHATRVTHGYQNLGVSSKLHEVNNFPTWVIFSLKVI